MDSDVLSVKRHPEEFADLLVNEGPNALSNAFLKLGKHFFLQQVLARSCWAEPFNQSRSW